MMHPTCVAVVGGGQAGLAVSRLLARAGVDHVVLERGRVADRWRTRGWDSLRLLTPNWMLHLPGQPADHPEPDGFLGADEVADLIDGALRATTRASGPSGPSQAKYAISNGVADKTRARAAELLSRFPLYPEIVL
jgi:cation diffusion facilitator CzcD-associated flavoprotein CzcO